MKQPSDDLAIYSEMIILGNAGEPSALATVVEVAGSSPRKPGAKMLVKRDGSIMGSIGGGPMEQEVIYAALRVMGTGKPEILESRLTENSGHACGGNMRIFIASNNAKPRLVIAGAGHIGQALSHIAGFAGFHVTVVDDRAAFACREKLPDADEIFPLPVPEAFTGISFNENTAILIASPDFEKDIIAAAASLNTSAGYISLVGSIRKKKMLCETLKRDGYSEGAVARIYIPAGLAIGAETPEEIAVSILAQLVGWKRNNV